MIKKRYYKKGDRTLWLKMRDELSDQGMIGGSDISVLLDANPWKSAIELFYTAIGFTPKSRMTNEKMHWGTETEDIIAEMYRYFDLQTQSLVENYDAGLQVNPVRNVNAIITNDKYPFLFANIDKYLGDIDGIGEIKNMNGFVLDAYNEPNIHLDFIKCPVGVPVGYYAQLQQYMMVYEKDRGRFIFNRDGSQLITYDIFKDEHLQERIQEVSIDFAARVELGKKIMKEHKDEHKRIQLLTAIEPEITDSESYNKFRTQQILAREQRDIDMTMKGTPEQLTMGLDYMVQAGIIKGAKDLQTLSGNQIKTEIFKNGIEVIDFGSHGKISMKKRLSVKVNMDG